MATRPKLWLALLIALVLAQAAACLLLPRGESLTAASDLIQAGLLLVATLAFLVNLSRSRGASLQVRLFWAFMSTGMVSWLAYQGLWNYIELVERLEVPEPFLGDIVLFLHLVPMIAALALLPHLREDERDERVRMLDFALLIAWWVFIYVYAVIPWQTVQVNATAYATNFNFAYLTEKLALLAALAIVARTARGGWRAFYAQLFGASALYASSSYVANWAISRHLYYSGSLYDIPLSVSIAWMAAAALLALRLDLSSFKPPEPVRGVWISRLSMLALFSLVWAAMHAELDARLPNPVKAFRITVSLIAMIAMGVVVFWRQRLLREELSLFLEKSRHSFQDLQGLQDKLIQSEKLASLGQLVGGAAHEINNPLTAMLGYSELLSASDLPPEEKLQAEDVAEQVRRTTTLVASLLTFSRQAPAQLAAVDINSVLQTAARLLAPQLNAQASSIHLELTPALPLVLVDSNQILHVCMHLAGQVGTRLNSETNSRVFISTQRRDNSVLVDFSSHDASATPSMLSEFGTEGPTKPSTLSLGACCRIVEEHGGRLLRATTPGNPVFRVELRLAAGAPSFTSMSAPGRAAARGNS